MKRLIILFLLISKANIAYVQNLNTSDSIKEFLYNETYKNIAALNIKYSKHSAQGLDKKNLLNTNTGFFFDAFITDFGFRLKMDIKELSQTYPLSNYKLYQVCVDIFNHINKNENIEKKYAGIAESHFDKYYLLAFDNQNREIKFISGMFFRNKISNDFNFDIHNPKSYIEYLKLKTFFMRTKDLTFNKKKGRKLYYKAFSEEIKKEVTIILPLKDIENPIVYIHDKLPYASY